MKMKKWRVNQIIDNKEQFGLQWVRNGIAMLGEPSLVCRIEYYKSANERDQKLFGQSPNFAIH